VPSKSALKDDYERKAELVRNISKIKGKGKPIGVDKMI
jgi:hypothetical protein